MEELRYSDGPTTEAEVFIEAPPAAVWALVSDIELPARFSSEFQGADWLDGATAGSIGARFVGRNVHDAIGTWETTCVITECDPARTFGFAVGDPEDPSALWRFTLEPHASGTKLRQWMRMGPARSGISIAIDAMPDKESRILHRRLAEHRTNMETTLRGIKEIAEGRRTRSA